MILTFALSFFVFGLPLYFVAARRVLPLDVRAYAVQHAPAALASVALLLTVYLVRAWAGELGLPLVEMAVTASSAVVVYVLVLTGLDRRIMADLRRVLLGGAA